MLIGRALRVSARRRSVRTKGKKTVDPIVLEHARAIRDHFLKHIFQQDGSVKSCRYFFFTENAIGISVTPSAPDGYYA